MSARIVLAAGTFADADVERMHAGARAEVAVAPLATPQQVAANTRLADAVIVTNNPLGPDHLAAMGAGVRIVARAGIGLDAIDLETARSRGLAVYHVPDYATAEVATHAVAMLLALHRRLVDADRLARSAWSDWRSLAPIRPLHEATVGIVGLGRIGAAVAERLGPLAAEVVAYDPVVESPPSSVRRASTLESLLEASDAVTLHVPLTPETAGLIAAEELARMRDDALLVNVSRGGLVDEPALVAALQAGRLGGVALDVLAVEPPDPRSPLLLTPRVLLSPHVAWYSESAEIRLRRNVIDAVVAYLAGDRTGIGRFAIDPTGGGRATP